VTLLLLLLRCRKRRVGARRMHRYLYTIHIHIIIIYILERGNIRIDSLQLTASGRKTNLASNKPKLETEKQFRGVGWLQFCQQVIW
jgi:hypothetical protein